jgi:hypothetical protein
MGTGILFKGRNIPANKEFESAKTDLKIDILLLVIYCTGIKLIIVNRVLFDLLYM